MSKGYKIAVILKLDRNRDAVVGLPMKQDLITAFRSSHEAIFKDYTASSCKARPVN